VFILSVTFLINYLSVFSLETILSSFLAGKTWYFRSRNMCICEYLCKVYLVRIHTFG